MGKPAYKVKIGSSTFDSSLDQEIISVRVDLDMDVPSDSFEIAFKPSTKAGSIRVGDPAVIELGYDGELNRVLTGSIDVVEASISQVTISGLSRISSLTRLRVNQVYEKQSAGFIVKDLAGRAEVSIGVAEEGLSFPMYVVEDAKDVYSHMKELALRCGFDLFLCGDGKLAFKKYARQSAKIFEYGLNAMEADVHETIRAA
jgi:prophage tail gpP-like protein